jgi:hypothetical protein
LRRSLYRANTALLKNVKWDDAVATMGGKHCTIGKRYNIEGERTCPHRKNESTGVTKVGVQGQLLASDTGTDTSGMKTLNKVVTNSNLTRATYSINNTF